MKRSKFNLSNYKLLTGFMGELIPCGLTEVLPGDTIQHATSMLVRASPLVTPPMHPVVMKVHHWFVPTRLLWEDWEKFITGGADGNDASVFPTIDVGINEAGDLADYLGVPLGADVGEVSALPFRAYNLIFNEWYRDQDLGTAAVISKASGLDATTEIALRTGNWEKDYFTSCRPWEQKGDAVTLPLGTSAPVSFAYADPFLKFQAGGVDSVLTSTAGAVTSSQDGAITTELASATPITGLADLSTATAATVNDIREAFALQRYKEARARYGSRYTEYLAYLGVRSSDSRLQRPEYLGGGKQNLQFSEILQTGSTTTDPNGVGQLYGHGIGSLRSNRYRKFFEEHGFVISLLQIQPRTMYAQGLARMWNRRVKEDFWQKELEHIGQQMVTNGEIYWTGVPADDGAQFGFQDRYDEYRRTESSVAGEFRAGESMTDWHFARIFAGPDAPVLNESFIESNPAMRCFQDQVSPPLIVMAYHQMVARRMVAQTGSSFIY